MKKIYGDRRKFGRFSMPVALNIPAFSDLPLIPEDVSASGVMVIIFRKPAPECVLDCKMHITGGAVFQCRARVEWERDNGTVPPSWSVGLSFELSEEEKKSLEVHVHDLVSEFWGAQSARDFADSKSG